VKANIILLENASGEMNMKGISRREFLKVTGALAAVATTAQLPRARWLEEANGGRAAAQGEEQVFRSVCRMCHGTCATLVHVRNGRVVKIEGNPEGVTNQGSMCVRGLSTIQHQYNPRRLRYPMKRVGNRGDGQWQRISWDEAYQLLADKLTETWDKYGKQAVALCGGTGRHWQDWYGIFQNAMGIGLRFGMPPLCYLPRIEVITRMIGYRIPVADYFGFKGDKPKLVVHWGNNVTYSHADGMHGSRPLAMANEGAKVIVIDPVYTNLAQKADLWLPIKPATDTALAMGFLNVIINEDLYDHEFVEQWSNLPGLVRQDTGVMLTEYALRGEEAPPFHGPPFAVRPPEKIVVWDAEKDQAVIAAGPEIKPKLSGTFEVKLGDGTTVTCRTAWDMLVERVNEYPLSKVAEITWVPEDKIKAAAQMIAETKGWALQWGVSFDQWGVNSSRAVQAAMMLVALTGDLDIPGGMAMWSPPPFRMAGFPGEIGPYVAPEMFPAQLLPPEVSELAAKYNPFPFERGHSDYVNRAVVADELKFEMLWVVGANPLLNSMNTNEVYKGLQKFPFIVNWDLYMTPTAMMSDLVLPVAMWTEREFIVDCHLVWGIMSRPRTVQPVGEARSDEEGTFGLVDVLKQRDPKYWNEVIPWKTYQEWLDWRLEPLGITWKQLQEQFIYPFKQEPYSYKKTGFLLPAGRAELFLRAAQDAKQDPLPFYVTPPLFNLEGDLAKEYPLLCTTRRVPTYFHTEYRQVPWLREIFPEPLVEINPRTAKDLGIQDGDWVYLESPKGKAKQKAVVTEFVHPQVVVSNHDFWFPEAPQTLPELGGVFESNHNLLTYNDPSQGYDPLNGCPQLRGFLVKVYKANDGPPKGLDPQQVMTWTPVEEV
jgi:anaerobic selenocysteine-containing dehydrogenase